MLWLVYVSIASNLFLDVACAAALIPTTTSPYSKPTIVQRDDNVATVTLGDIGQYINYDGEDSVDKASVAIFPTGIITELPEDGIHIAFGPDMRKTLDETAAEHCKDPKDTQRCAEEINKQLQDSTLKTHSKRFLAVAGAVAEGANIIRIVVSGAVVAVMGMVAAEAVKGPGPAPDSINFEKIADDGVLAQFNRITSASLIAIATGSDNEIMATLTVSAPPASTPTHQPDEAVTVEEITEDIGNNKKGGIMVHVPEKTANKLMDYLAIHAINEAEEAREICQASTIQQFQPQARSDPSERLPPTMLREECSQRIGQLSDMVLNAALEGEMQQLIPTIPNNPMNPANNVAGGLVPNLQAAGTSMVADRVRQRFANRNPTQVEVNVSVASIGLIVSVIMGFVLLIRSIGGPWNFLVPQDNLQRLKIEDWKKCSKDLICLEDDCKGYQDIGPVIPMFGEKERYQTGRCTTGDNSGCLCEELDEPYIYAVEGDDYFGELAKFIKELQEAPTPSCDANNKMEIDPKRFKDSIGSACNNHDELRRRKKRGLNGWTWDTVEHVHGKDLQWAFDWNDKGEECGMTCQDVFQAFQNDDKCSWDVGVSKAGFIDTDCGTASYTVDTPNPATCFEFDIGAGAPRGQREIDDQGVQGTSVEQALEQFCNDIDGQKVEASDDGDKVNQHTRRWGYAVFGVPDRRSFWLRAQYAPRPGCQGYEWPHKTNCKASFKQGMGQCSGGPRTDGFLIQGIGCIDYSLHVTTNVFDDSPPWTKPTLRFPPPEDAPKDGNTNRLECQDQGQPSRPLSDEDLNKAIDAFCSDREGKEIRGFHERGHQWANFYDYPPRGQPQFYNHEKYTMHRAMAAETVNYGAPAPYDDMDHCKNFDWKMVKDDCTYALRKGYHNCLYDDGTSAGADFTYRCVHYREQSINSRDD